MKLAQYNEYLALFNARNYRGLLEFWAPEFEASFAGVVLRKGEDLVRFYEFFHSHVQETITVRDYLSDDHLLALRATVRLEGKRQLTKETLAAAGYPGLVPLSAGQVVELPQLILYRLKGAKFVQVYCGIY